jgi:hypothetical protein
MLILAAEFDCTNEVSNIVCQKNSIKSIGGVLFYRAAQALLSAGIVYIAVKIFRCLNALFINLYFRKNIV